ncbi:MAG: restriction endonuclease subunit S [Saprospiraceae bacterium]|nr:restriction endonuclease subunit S [Candidatus Vicinibacter affinis]
MWKYSNRKNTLKRKPRRFWKRNALCNSGDFIDYNKFALGSERRLSEAGFKKLKNKILPSGSVIVTCIGSDMGKIAISTLDCITNQQMNSIVVSQSSFTDYLYYCLQSIAGEIKGNAMGGSTMPMLSKTDFEKLK